MNKIWLSSPHMGGTEQKQVQEVFKDNWIAPVGPHIKKFEDLIKDYINAGNVVALNSATAAIHLALKILNIGTGDEVICSTFTFVAAASPITYLGATPIFVDSEYDSWNMSPQLLEEAIKDRTAKGNKPKAIIIVYLYGGSAKVEEIVAIANKYDIPLIEDAAEAFGSLYKGKSLGTFGDMGIFSFNGNKIITTSGGGALISDNEDYINRAEFLSTQARDDAPHYQHTQIGFNYRMSNVSAAIGVGQMDILDKHIQLRRDNYEFYKKELGIDGIDFIKELDDTFSNRWLTCMTINPTKFNGKTREDIRLALEEENIEARPLWKPMHLQPVFADCPAYTNGVSESLFNDGLCIPSGSNLTTADLERVVSGIKKALQV